MNVTPPQNLRDLILFIWKIVDSPTISKDRLVNIIALDLYLVTPPNAREMITKAIESGFLSENRELEEISLANPLMEEFTKWQAEGEVKAKQIQAILHRKWRPPFEIDENFRYNVLIRDIIDELSWSRAQKIRSSWIKFQIESPGEQLQGTMKEPSSDGEMASELPFDIRISQRTIIHSCPEYNQLRKAQKKLCTHLGAVVVKMYAQDKVMTTKFIEDLIEQREQWIFQ
jgi:hypothetical protein